jgi:hypothetical protein
MSQIDIGPLARGVNEVGRALREADVEARGLSNEGLRMIDRLVERLKDVLAMHPGTTEVHLHLTSSGRTTVLRLDDRLRVTPSPALYGDLKALLGPTCLT